MSFTTYIKRALLYIIHGQPTKYITANITYTSPSEKLKDKKIIVTGGGRGLGKAMAKRFVQEGAKVLITGRNEQVLKETSEELKCEFLCLDVIDVDRFDAFLKEADKILDGANCLVNPKIRNYHPIHD